MGYYGGWNYDPEELAEQEQKILDTFGANKDNYVIVGLAPRRRKRRPGHIRQHHESKNGGNITSARRKRSQYR